MRKAIRWSGVVLAIAVCGLAGLLVFRRGVDIVVRENAGCPTEPTTQTTFRIVSFNVQARPFLDDAAEKLPQIAERLVGYDIVAIQECFQRPELLFGNRTFPGRIHFGRLESPWRVTGSGLGILSKFLVDDVAMEHFRDVGELQNQLASKGMVMARMYIGNHAVDVYNTHMEAGSKPSAQVARRGQAAQLVEFVRTHSPAANAVIVTGDFNMSPLREGMTGKDYRSGHFDSEEDFWARTSAYQIMADGLGFRDAHDELFGPTGNDIERFLFRDGARCHLRPLYCYRAPGFERADGTALSDGAPLVVQFRLEDKT